MGASCNLYIVLKSSTRGRGPCKGNCVYWKEDSLTFPVAQGSTFYLSHLISLTLFDRGRIFRIVSAATRIVMLLSYLFLCNVLFLASLRIAHMASSFRQVIPQDPSDWESFMNRENDHSPESKGESRAEPRTKCQKSNGGDNPQQQKGIKRKASPSDGAISSDAESELQNGKSVKRAKGAFESKLQSRRQTPPGAMGTVQVSPDLVNLQRLLSGMNIDDVVKKTVNDILDATCPPLLRASVSDPEERRAAYSELIHPRPDEEDLSKLYSLVVALQSECSKRDKVLQQLSETYGSLSVHFDTLSSQHPRQIQKITLSPTNRWQPGSTEQNDDPFPFLTHEFSTGDMLDERNAAAVFRSAPNLDPSQSFSPRSDEQTDEFDDAATAQLLGLWTPKRSPRSP